MNEFQYIIAKEEWEKLTTKAAKKRFIHKVYENFYKMTHMTVLGVPYTQEFKTITRFLWKIIGEVPQDLLPKYIPGTVHYFSGRL